MKHLLLLSATILLYATYGTSQVQIDTFYYTGSAQTVTLTAGMLVGPTTIDIRGGQGGDLNPGFGGNGGQVIATMNFSAGDVLTINVGKKGNSDVNQPVGVFVGSGGTDNNPGTLGGVAGSGGGASDIRLNGNNLNNRILVAGGGGGCGGASGASLNNWPGGLGGGLIGGDGTNASGFTNGGGKGGSQSAGGAVGTSTGAFCAGTATAGALGLGGVGSGDIIGGGGGGGGYYGGGGACFSGGGGGSSYTDPSATNVIHNQGFQSGDGMVIITYSTCLAANLIESACDSLISPSGNYTWYTSAVHNDTISPMLSCTDTAITVDLTINNSSINNVHLDACSAYLWPANNTVYLSSGVYTAILQSIAGCDSTVLLDLNIITPVNHDVVVESCESYTWPTNGQTYTSSTNFSTTAGGSSGCDTTYNLMLTINNGTSSSDSIASCNSYTWPVNGITYTSTGQYTETFTTIAGCDSIRILNLTINDIDATVTNQGSGILSANASLANYQWLDCENGFSILQNDTNQLYTATGAGSFAVQINQNGCIDTSNCFTYYLEIQDINSNQIVFYPNPFQSELNIDLGELYNVVEVNISEVSGKVVKSYRFEKKQMLKLDFDSRAGYYLIEIKTDSGLRLTQSIFKQ